jgi:hypothetical protein
MPRPRSEIRRIREVLRLPAELGDNLSAVAARVGLARSTVRTYLRRAAAAKIDARAELSFETLQQMEGQFRAGARKLAAERQSRGLIDESLGSMPEITLSQAFGKYQRTVKRHGKLAPLSASSVNHRLNMPRSVMVRARECGRFAFPRSIGNRCA